MLLLKDVTLSYGARVLFEKANGQLYTNQRVGLVGRNGCGKSSLFKLILGEIESQSGEFSLPNDTLVAHVEQEILDTSILLVDYIVNAHPIYFNEQIDLPEYYSIVPNAQKLLTNLGFNQDDFDKPLAEFSGGWQMRANLAKALFVPSDLLLLDEPTNHLDLETVLWLEGWLKAYRGLAIIISHDREFLDNVTTHTVAIYNKTLNIFGGNYSTYQRTRAEKELLASLVASRTQAKIDHLQNFVDRFKAKASKAKQAQSRMKMIEKMQVNNVFSKDRDYDIEFFTPEYSSNKLLTLIDGSVGYSADKPIISNMGLQIFAQDRIGLLGKNGRGKTTLIKALIEGDTLLSGEVEKNVKLKIGYFSQHSVEDLDEDDTPFSFTQRQNKEMKSQEIYGYLGRFGFDKTSTEKHLSVFSGGEKSRLILANIILSRPNILFLDEPTNHLDMSMREELAMALQDFEGAVVLVSHDKFLLQSVVDDFYLIDNNTLQQFDGDLDDYQNYLLKPEEKKDDATKIKGGKKSKQKPAYVSPESRKQKVIVRDKISVLDKELAAIAAQISTINTQMLDPEIMQSHNVDKYRGLIDSLAKYEQKQAVVESEWLKLSEELESI